MPGISGRIGKGTTLNTIVVALAVCLVCSVVVSASAVYLKPLQVENKRADRQKNILEAAGLLREGESVEELFKQVEAKVVDLDTGEYVKEIDAQAYDQRAASRDPERSAPIPSDKDVAGIKRQAEYATVYLVNDEQGRLQYIILPVHGYGLWSTLYGFLALEDDANTVVGLKFYEHGETPGLGGEVDNIKWRRQWKGKLVYDDGEPEIEVLKGTVDPDRPAAKYQVDGLAGATLTSRGVTNLLQFWLGENGFKPYLDRIRTGGA